MTKSSEKPLFDTTNDPTRVHDVTGGSHPHPRHHRQDDGNAFLPDPYSSDDEPRLRATTDAVVEDMGEGFIEGATSGGAEIGLEQLDEVTDEEEGGPYLEEAEEREFAGGTDGANPADATREPFPATMRGGREPGRSS